MKDVTVVSSLYNINRENLDGRKWEEYLEWFVKTLQVKAPMVVFVEEDMVDFVKDARGDRPTEVIPMPLEKIPYYHLKDEMDSVMNLKEYTDKVSDSKRIECKSSLYNIIQYSKFKWAEIAVEKNFFDSDYYLWMDAGLSRFFYDMDMDKNYPGENAKTQLELVDDKVLIQVFESFYPDLFNAKTLSEDYLLDNRSFVMGGMFGVGAAKIKELCSKVDEVLQLMLSKNIVNNEQIALGYLYKKYPDMFVEFINDARIHRSYELIVELSE